ncbi:MAG TPA: hypothetical protein VFV52_01315 [Bacilli bacterium]|nr:hypothetical protein [Bacilli bacterium]
MIAKKAIRSLSTMLTASLLAASLLPGSAALAAAPQAENGNRMPVIYTQPEANATTVRPDTAIEMQLDQSDPFYKQWAKKYNGEITLTLLNDGGQAVYSSEDSELTFDDATGTVTFTPPELLNRYTTYGVVITPEQLPNTLRKDATRKQLPKRPDFKVEEVPMSDVVSKVKAHTEQQLPDESDLPSIVEDPTYLSQQIEALQAEPGLDFVKKAKIQKYNALLRLQAENRSQYVGPKPVKAVDAALHPIRVTDGTTQKGVIERIEGQVITLFGGTQFTVDTDTHIHLQGAGQNTLADLKPGDFVTVTVNAQSAVKNINVTTPEGVLSYVFTTGSALHEPTHVSVEQTEERPRVTEDGHFTLVSTDDYGLPAWGSETSIDLQTQDGTDLDASAQVLPSAAFTTSSQDGRTDVTIVDHKVQRIAAKVSMDGPNRDGYDAHGFAVFFDFRPGMPAQATLSAPQEMVVGTMTGLSGTVTDVYGNAVEDGTVLKLQASAGEVDTPVNTFEGKFSTTYEAATKTQDVTLSVKSETGTAKATTTVHLLPDVPANATLDAPSSIQAGESVVLSGKITDRYGNNVLDGTSLLFSATAGELAANGSTTAGHYEVTYTAPTKVQRVSLAVASQEGTAQQDVLVEIVPGPVANLTLQAQDTSLAAGATTDLSGQASDRYDNLINDQEVALAAEHGSLSNSAPHTNEAGVYGSVYEAPTGYTGQDTVTAKAGDASASLNLEIVSDGGVGYNPATGQTEPVAVIRFVPQTQDATLNQVVVLKGYVYNERNQILQDVVFTASHTTGGTIESMSYKSGLDGSFTVTVRTPNEEGAIDVTVTSGEISGTATLNITPYGFGYNAKTGKWEAVYSIDLDAAAYIPTLGKGINRNYNITINPGKTVQFVGHAANASGDPLSQVQFNRLALTSGSANLTRYTDANGDFTLTYEAPSTEGNQILQFGTGNTLTTIYMSVDYLGQGYNPATGQWEDVANIVFNPSDYTVDSSQGVTLTGKVTNALGQPLMMAKVLTQYTNGYAPSQVITGPDGTFSFDYVSPMTNQNYTEYLYGYVDGSRYGMATIHVNKMPDPYFVNPFIHIYHYDITWGGNVFYGNGVPLTRNNADRWFRLEDTFNHPAWYWMDYILPNASGYLNGPSGYAMWQYYYYSVDRYGVTVTYYYWYNMTAYRNGHHLPPSYNESFHVREYIY